MSRERISNLVKTLNEASDSYYNKGISLMTDKDYDIMFKELIDLENEFPELVLKDSPTNKVGFASKSTFEKVKHTVPMLSLDNSYNKEDVDMFIRRVKKQFPKARFAMEYKYDGVSISLEYSDSELIRAVTRGNGEVGDDVTENIKMISDIPRVIEGESFSGIVRGEIVMSRVNFLEINRHREENGSERYMNPRNTVAGTIRQHDPTVVRDRRLESRMYYVHPNNCDTQSGSLQLLGMNGFNVGSFIRTYSNTEDIMKDILEVEAKRHNFNIDIDGMVIKVEQTEYWEELGYTGRAPRWAIAYKFDTEKAQTVLRDVTWQVGRTGKLTPVAEFDSVTLAGTTVSRATLHNMDRILAMDLRIGDTINVEKAAEIIPQILGVMKSIRTGKEKFIEMPNTCPDCNGELRREEGKVDTSCINWNCPSRLALRIEHFISRDAINVTHMGPSLISTLIKEGVLTQLTDVYKLEDLFKNSPYPLENKVGLSVAKAKSVHPSALLYGLGIPGVGRSNAKKLIDKFCSISNLLTAELSEIVDVVGVVVGGNIKAYANTESTAVLLEELTNKYKVKTEMDKCVVPIGGKFNGKFFVLTGKMKYYLNKREITDLIEKNGGLVLSSVSKSVDYVVYGDDAGSKLAKAKQTGCECITEIEFKELLDN